jgi:hypothetical protein
MDPRRGPDQINKACADIAAIVEKHKFHAYLVNCTQYRAAQAMNFSIPSMPALGPFVVPERPVNDNRNLCLGTAEDYTLALKQIEAEYLFPDLIFA